MPITPELDDPFAVFGQWLEDAAGEKLPEAVFLSTIDVDNRPSSRTVLLKFWNHDGFCFYSNKESRKGRNLEINPSASMLFYWKSLDRQVRIEGRCERLDEQMVDNYFHTRTRDSQIGACISAQSRPLAGGPMQLKAEMDAAKAKYGTADIPRPDYWVGWCLKPDYFEFWQDGEFRLHERRIFKKTNSNTTNWQDGFLYP